MLPRVIRIFIFSFQWNGRESWRPNFSIRVHWGMFFVLLILTETSKIEKDGWARDNVRVRVGSDDPSHSIQVKIDFLWFERSPPQPNFNFGILSIHMLNCFVSGLYGSEEILNNVDVKNYRCVHIRRAYNQIRRTYNVKESENLSEICYRAKK